MIASPPPLNILMLYEDANAAASAMNTYHRIRQQLGKEYAFDLNAWRLELLDLPSCALWATRDLGRADMVIIASGRCGKAWDSFKTWSVQWPVRAASSPKRAVAALYVNRSDESSSHCYKEWLSFLQGLTDRTGMDLLTHVVDPQSWQPVGPTAAGPSSHSPTRHRKAGELAGSRRSASPRWGINE